MEVTLRSQLRTSGRDNMYVVVTGISNELVNRIVDTTFKSAVQRAPRSNATRRPADHRSLRKGTHYREYAKGANSRGAVGNNAPHALVVHEGRGPINAKSEAGMRWYNEGGNWPGAWKMQRVGGAAAQPWLVDAYNSARKIHDLENVRPMSRRRRRVT